MEHEEQQELKLSSWMVGEVVALLQRFVVLQQARDVRVSKASVSRP